MDLVRSILLRLEESEKIRNGSGILKDLANDDSIRAHLKMLEDAGFLEHANLQAHGGVRMSLGWRITWAGHEFLDTVRDPEIWRKTKAGADKLGSWTIKLLAEVAAGFVRAKAQELGLPI
jgi:hypothetical protein